MRATPKWNIGTNLTYRGSIFARGDEDNQDVNGTVAGYFLIDLDTTYNVTKQLQVFATRHESAQQALFDVSRFLERTSLTDRTTRSTAPIRPTSSSWDWVRREEFGWD